jgi:lipopolysaccharide export system protein LptA
MRYARWAAAAALALTALVAGVYLRRAVRESRAERNAPPAIPAAVEQQSAAFSFSKVEQEQTLFTVSASHAVEFKDSDRSRLDDVSITVFGKQGTRNDRIRAKSCDYQSSSGRMICKGQTQIDLESAEDARKSRGQRAMHVETSDVTFERETGKAVTDAPATFRFPNGTGTARGVEYDSQEGIVVLDHDVGLQLKAAQHPADPVTQIQGTRLEFSRADSVMHLAGPVRVVRGPQLLTAGEMRLQLDQDLRVKRAEAHGSPELRFTQTSGISVLDADEMSAELTPAGDVSRLAAEGRAHGQRRTLGGNAQEQDTFSADRVEVLMNWANPRANEARQLTASGNVAVKSQQAETSRTLRTASLQLAFAPVKRGGAVRLEGGETLAPGVVQLLSLAEKTTLSAGRLLVTFDDRGQIQMLQGKNGVIMDRVSLDQADQDHKTADHEAPNLAASNHVIPRGKTTSGESPSAPEHMTAQDLYVHYAVGDWTELEARGDVRYRQADHSAEADFAHIMRAANTIRLDGSPQVADANSRTTAAHIEMNQATGAVTAAGRVFTIDNSPGSAKNGQMTPGQPGGLGLGSGAAQISADRLEGNSQSGIATYTGHARMWQEDTIVQADNIRLDRNAQQLDATGRVMAQLPQDASKGSKQVKSANQQSNAAGRMGAGQDAAQKTANASLGSPTAPTVWTIHAPHLTYSGSDGRVHFETGVSAESNQGRMDSRTLDVFLKSSATGQLGVDHAEAIANVVIEQPGRRGTAERGDYFAAEGKYVLSGGQPKLVDDAHGTTTGHSLTYFVANDTILVDARGGSRTLTEHRIEK